MIKFCCDLYFIGFCIFNVIQTYNIYMEHKNSLVKNEAMTVFSVLALDAVLMLGMIKNYFN